MKTSFTTSFALACGESASPSTRVHVAVRVRRAKDNIRVSFSSRCSRALNYQAIGSPAACQFAERWRCCSKKKRQTPLLLNPWGSRNLFFFVIVIGYRLRRRRIAAS
jgi:hypothetical protein